MRLSAIPGLPPLLACAGLIAAWELASRVFGISGLPPAHEALRESDLAVDPLADVLANHLASGKSGLVEADGRTLFLTVQVPPVRLVVVGAVHISQAMASMAAGLDLAADIAPEVPQAILGDPVRLGQVVSTFVSNALKFTEAGHVSVRMALDAGDGRNARLFLRREERSLAETRGTQIEVGRKHALEPGFERGPERAHHDQHGDHEAEADDDRRNADRRLARSGLELRDRVERRQLTG